MIPDPMERLRLGLRDSRSYYDEQRERNRLETERRIAQFRQSTQPQSPVMPTQPTAGPLPAMLPPTTQVGSPLGVDQPDLEDIGSEDSGWFNKAARFMSNALSPVAIPQDMLFATLAGWADPDKSVADYFSEMDWATYAPFGDMPERPASGQDLLRLYGVENENASFWGGLAMDLVADPLMVGAAVRALARVSDVAGAVQVARSLRTAADGIDTAAESTMLLGLTPTARVVTAARTLPGFRQFEQTVQTNVIQRYVTPALTPILQRTVTAPEFLGGRSYSVGGLFLQDAGRLPGAPEMIRRANAVSQEVAENTMIDLIRADAMAGGNRWRGWLRSFNRSLTVMYDVPVQTVNNFNPGTSRAIMTSAYAQADHLGLSLDPTRSAVTGSGVLPSSLPARAAQSPELFRGIDDITSIIDQQRNVTRVPMAERAEQRNIVRQFNSEVARIRQVAIQNGDDPDLVENAYRGVVGTFQRVSAIEGYFASGAGALAEVFTQNLSAHILRLAATNTNFSNAINRAGGVATVTREAWRELIRSGARNQAHAAFGGPIRMSIRHMGLPGARYLAQADLDLLRYENMFENYSQIAGLDLPTYFNNLTRGHMRRAFGAFMDEDSWRAYVADTRAGNIATNTVINDAAIDAQVRAAGFSREADLVQEYLRQISPPSPVGSATRNPNPPGAPPTPRAMGGFVRMTDLAEYLLSRGITATDFERYQRAFVAAAQPELNRVADQLAAYGRANIGQNINIASPIGTGADVLSTARHALGQDEVDTLMELMDPIVSRAQTAVAATSATRRMESLTSILGEAQRRGLILDSQAAAAGAAPRWWVSVPHGQGGYLQGLGGMTVHPMVYREVRNVMTAGRRSHRQASALQTLRSMVTAGYLSSPATSAANIAGGFWTAAMYGINPTALMTNMAQVYRDWRRLGRDLPELAHMRGIVDNGQAHTEIVSMGGDLADIANLNNGVRGFSQAISNGVRRYHEVLRRPLGTGALGLGFFELSEALFKMGTFRMVMNQTGGNVAEARRMARFVVFDYANQPGIVQMARDTGLFLFPAFEYFMTGRTVNALFRQPALIAGMERAPGVISEAVVQDEEQRNAMLAGMPDWMRSGKFIPIRTKENGDVTLFPWAQLFPTSGLTGQPFADSLVSAGLWGPLYDVANALIGISGDKSNSDTERDPGASRIGGQFGRRVLDTGVRDWSDPTQVIGDVASFLYNSFAPAFVKKLYSPAENFDREARGIVPAVIRTAFDVPATVAASGRTVRETYSRRVDQDLFEAILSFGLRTTRTVATSGPTADTLTVVRSALVNFQGMLRDMDRRIEMLVANGKLSEARSVLRLRATHIERFKARWGDRVRELRRMEEGGRFDPPPPVPAMIP